jgi:hypothetical protein
MPGSLAITTSNLQSVQITIDGGTKPGTTGHYKITRRPHSTAVPGPPYLNVMETVLAVVYDHPRPRSTVGVLATDTQLLWDYKVYSYITATSSYDVGIEDTNSTAGYGIAEIEYTAASATTYIDPSGVAEPTTSAGTMGNTYLAQAESVTTNAYDRDSWTVTKVIPLAASSA